MQNCQSGTQLAAKNDQRTHRKKSAAQPSITAIAEAWASQKKWPSCNAIARDIVNAFGHIAPPHITPLMVGALVSDWRKRHKPQTAYNYRSKLRQVLAIAEQYGAPHIVPAKVPIPHARATIATGDELVRLFKQPTPWLRLYMLLYFQCGLRRAEALRVTPRSWNREHHTVTVEVKGGSIRTAQVSADVELLFETCGDPDPDTPYLHLLRGRKITADGLKFAWQKHRAACGVNSAVTAHDLRRTAATILYTATKDLRVAQQLLGHKSLTSTLQYLAPMAPDEVRKYSELLRFENFKSETKQ